MKMGKFISGILTAGFLYAASAAYGTGVEIWISPQSPANTSAAGTPNDPFKCPDGTSLYAVLANSAPPDSVIHFLPGTFILTNGVLFSPGWKIRGAGIDNTIIRLAPLASAPGGGKMSAFGGETGYYRTDGAEISDLTVDCNLQNQTNSLAVGAVLMAGNNTRISRVHAINWGTTKAGSECFVLAMTEHPATGITTNCIIEDCIVDTPAAVTHADGTTAISLFNGGIESPGTNLIVGGEVRGNLVNGITPGVPTTGSPAYLHAYAIGAFSGYLHDNRAINIPGGIGFYQDTWSGGDAVVARNIFENVRLGICFNATTFHTSRVKLIGNVITPTSDGGGISYYTGEPSTNSTNAYATQLLIKDNIIHPLNGASYLDSGALALNGIISATVVGNILDGGTNGPDVWIAWWQHPTVKMDMFSENYNLQGTALRMCTSADYNWRPGYVDVIKFTPQANSNGWYRIASALAHCSGVIEICGADQSTDGVQTDVEFSYRVRAYTSDTTLLGDLGTIRQGSYPKASGSNGGAITKARIASNNPSDNVTYVDVYVGKSQSPVELTVRIRGYNRGMIYNHPQFISTTPAVIQELSL